MFFSNGIIQLKLFLHTYVSFYLQVKLFRHTYVSIYLQLKLFHHTYVSIYLHQGIISKSFRPQAVFVYSYFSIVL
jgi:hypothetical protein